MANRTDADAHSVHGTNPQVCLLCGLGWEVGQPKRIVLTPWHSSSQNLVEKITRMKIYSSMYWKEHCFALTAESLVDKAVDLKYAGGTFGGQVTSHGCCRCHMQPA